MVIGLMRPYVLKNNWFCKVCVGHRKVYFAKFVPAPRAGTRFRGPPQEDDESDDSPPQKKEPTFATKIPLHTSVTGTRDERAVMLDLSGLSDQGFSEHGARDQG